MKSVLGQGTGFVWGGTFVRLSPGFAGPGTGSG